VHFAQVSKHAVRSLYKIALTNLTLREKFYS